MNLSQKHTNIYHDSQFLIYSFAAVNSSYVNQGTYERNAGTVVNKLYSSIFSTISNLGGKCFICVN